MNLQLGSTVKTMFAGQSLNDDIYHAVMIRRKGKKLEVAIDHDDPIIGRGGIDSRIQFA